MALKHNAVEGLFGGFAFGAVEAWNKKVLFLIFVAFSVVFLYAISSPTVSNPEPFDGFGVWDFLVYLVAFWVGFAAAKLMYNEAFGD